MDVLQTVVDRKGVRMDRLFYRVISHVKVTLKLMVMVRLNVMMEVLHYI
jgi:hypothetical protein